MSFANNLIKKIRSKNREHIIRLDYKIGKDVKCEYVDYDDETDTIVLGNVTSPISDELKLPIHSVSVDVHLLGDKMHEYIVKPNKKVKLTIYGDYSTEELRDAVETAKEAGYEVTSVTEEENTIFYVKKTPRSSVV